MLVFLYLSLNNIESSRFQLRTGFNQVIFILFLISEQKPFFSGEGDGLQTQSNQQKLICQIKIKFFFYIL